MASCPSSCHLTLILVCRICRWAELVYFGGRVGFLVQRRPFSSSPLFFHSAFPFLPKLLVYSSFFLWSRCSQPFSRFKPPAFPIHLFLNSFLSILTSHFWFLSCLSLFFITCSFILHLCSIVPSLLVCVHEEQCIFFTLSFNSIVIHLYTTIHDLVWICIGMYKMWQYIRFS